MLADPAQARALVAQLRGEGHRGPWLTILAHLVAATEARGLFVSHEERPWASATFAGSRHRFMLDFTGETAIAIGDRLIEQLPDHEFAIPGHLVADATVIAVEHSLLDGPRMQVECEILLLRED